MHSVLDLSPQQLRGVRQFRLEDLALPGGRVTIFEPPAIDHDYAIGADMALGMENRDYDAAVVLDASVSPTRQVATAHGHWGERFDRVLFPLAVHYNEAFIMAERQCGLPILRSLVDDYEYGYLWYERNYAQRNKRQRDTLGWPKHHKRAFDPLLRAWRLAVREREVLLRDIELIDQMGRLQFTGPDSKEPEELVDQDMDLKLQGGGSPDLVYAGMYAWTACSEMGKFERPRPRYDADTLGAVLGHEELEGESPAQLHEPPPARKARRGRRR